MIARIPILLLAAVLTTCACGTTSTVGRDATVTFYPGVDPRMTPAEVTDLVEGLLRKSAAEAGTVLKPPKVLALTATTADHIGGLVGGNLAFQAVPGILWFVRVEGTFSTGNGLESSGYYLIADADGSLIGGSVR